MSAASAVRSNFNKYLSSSPNKFFDKANFWGGIWDDLAKLGQHSTGLAQHISVLVGNNEAAAKAQTLSEAFGEGRDIVSAVRFIPVGHKLITGQVFWQTNDSGWRRVRCDDAGTPIQIPRDQLGSVW